MNEIINFVIDEKLQKKGFQQHTYKTTNETEMIRIGEDICEADRTYSHPSINDVLKWLRDEKRIHINVDINEDGWGYSICQFRKVVGETCEFELDYLVSCYGNFISYEAASIAGIEYILNNDLI